MNEPERSVALRSATNSGVGKTPMSQVTADKDEVIKAALPDEMYRVFTHYKRDEWEKFMATVTEWDLKQYWDYLP